MNARRPCAASAERRGTSALRPALRPNFRWRRLAQRLHRAYPRRARLPLALVDVASQRLCVVFGRSLLACYPVSTSRYGIGGASGSERTPPGAHYVFDKIGAGEPPFARFQARVATGEVLDARAAARARRAAGRDVICTRILRLAGLVPRVNRGRGCDSLGRFIYIHGTPDEGRIGARASIGCVRMKNDDVIALFDALPCGALVYIAGAAPK